MYTRGVTKSENAIDVLQTVALKSECNLTVGQYRGCRKFALQNQVGTNLFVPYEKVLVAEGELDAGNVAYDVIQFGEIIEHHEAIPNSGTIDVDSDIGCISYEMLNPNIEGKFSLQRDSRASSASS